MFLNIYLTCRPSHVIAMFVLLPIPDRDGYSSEGPMDTSWDDFIISAGQKILQISQTKDG